MAFNLVLFAFLLWRTLGNWIIYLASKTVPYLGFFPYPYELFDFGYDHVTSALANFDGIHYLLIAHRGAYEQWEQAYFPLYPLMIRVFNFIFHNELITGLVVSNLSFLIGLFFALKLFKSKTWLLIFLLVFPTSFFFGAVYTEGLFFLLFILSLYFLKKEKYWLVSLFTILASMTRLIGVFLVIPITLHFLSLRATKRSEAISSIRSLRRLRLLAMTAVSPFIGLAIYCFYLYKTTGDPFMFLTSQPVFGANRSTNIILLPQVIWRYLKIFFTASHNYQFYVSLFEFVVFSIVLTVLIFDLLRHFKLNKNFKLKILNYDKLALNLFSFANLILPTLTGTLSSIPRYTLFSISFFLFLSDLKNQKVKIAIALIFAAFHVVVLALFSQGYFVG